MSLAVVLPFIDEQVDRRLIPTLHRWNTLSYTPCAPGERLSATAVFFHPLNVSQKEADITRTWSGLAAPARECFSGGVRFLYGSIEPSVAMAHPDGECEMDRRRTLSQWLVEPSSEASFCGRCRIVVDGLVVDNHVFGFGPLKS